MKGLEARRYVSFVFSNNADPGAPVELDKDAMRKLGDLPKPITALIESYGSKVGNPVLSGGSVRLELLEDDAEFFGAGSALASHLHLTACELEANAGRQPPLPLAQACTKRHCIDLLHVLAKVCEKSGLVASVDMGDALIPLPQVPLAHFTEPAKAIDQRKRINQKVIGVCIALNDMNVVVLANNVLLELPKESYSYTPAALWELVLNCSTQFLGWACVGPNDLLRAEPGGELIPQINL